MLSTGRLVTDSVKASTSTLGSNSYFQKLYFPSKRFVDNETSTYHLYCEIPPKQFDNDSSAFAGYFIDED